MSAKIPSPFALGEEQKESLSRVLDEIKEFRFPVSIYDIDAQYAFGLGGRDLVVRLQGLAVPILPAEPKA